MNPRDPNPSSAEPASTPIGPAIRRMFEAQDYQFQLGLRRAETDWFELGAPSSSVLAERRRWLAEATEDCCVWRPEAAPALREALGFFRRLPEVLQASPTPSLCRVLGELWEPDFLLLRRGADDEFRLEGGCVCFPSSWRVVEKLGQPVHTIHAPVPTLNERLGERIRRFLAQMKPGMVFERENWGLAAHGELNAHPDRPIPRLGPDSTIDRVWLRVEHQAFVPLPASDGLLFLIRLVVYPLQAVLAEAELARGFTRLLAAMPEEIAVYKGIAAARAALLRQLKDR